MILDNASWSEHSNFRVVNYHLKQNKTQHSILMIIAKQRNFIAKLTKNWKTYLLHKKIKFCITEVKIHLLFLIPSLESDQDIWCFFRIIKSCWYLALACFSVFVAISRNCSLNKRYIFIDLLFTKNAMKCNLGI